MLCGGSSESKHCDTGGATPEAVVMGAIMAVLLVVELACFAWFSEKPCLLIAAREGSLSIGADDVGVVDV